MPPEEGFGFDADQSVLPRKQPREQNHRQSGRIIRSAGFNFAFEVESQLFAKENVFRFNRSTQTRPQQQKSQSVPGEIKNDGNQAKQGMNGSHGVEGCHA